MVVLDKLGTREDRDWYAAKAVENGWSRPSLEFEIKMDLKSRLGSAPSNFAATLTELGRDMAFVGRQYRIEVGGDEFFVDLLFFHVAQLRYVVVELKVGKFQPAHMGQIGTYVAMVDGEVRDPDMHAKTVGILLCTERNDATLDYALAGTASPVAVALYEGLTPEERAALPDPNELEAVIEEEIQAHEAVITATPEPADLRA